MRLTFIITIDPIKDISLLNLAILSLNLQTCKAFNVVFYNQTLRTGELILSSLNVQPTFPYRILGKEACVFLDAYPIWDLYHFHAHLLEHDELAEYFISLHMEEFLSATYVSDVLEVLDCNDFDILFGNLSRLDMNYNSLAPLLQATSARQFDRCLQDLGANAAPHWASQACGTESQPFFGGHSALMPTNTGFTRTARYLAEDVYFIKHQFAKRCNWFLSGHRLPFEDIHICEQPQICELGSLLSELVTFPVYFNRSRIYHVPHAKYYYQLQDEAFTARMLDYQTSDPALRSLKHAIWMYRHERMSLPEAIRYCRRNANKSGTQDLNWQYHVRYLKPLFSSVNWARYAPIEER